MNKELKNKHQRLIDIIQGLKKICIAYSGGVDSALLLKISRDTLDEKMVLAATAVSNTYTASEKKKAEELAEIIGVKHIKLETDEMECSDFVSNNEKRCYYCKKSFYKDLLNVSRTYGFNVICDGSNTDDLSDYRMGKIAAEEFGVRSPMVVAGLTKNDIRILSRELGVPGWDRPANACLASRIPYGHRITADKLTAVGKAEEFIRSLGFNLVRVRHHGETARIEIPPSDFMRIIEEPQRKAVAKKLKEIGFTWISIDIEGYRTGSMNEVLDHNV